MNSITKYQQYDVCIIGAGIAGIFLAWLLGKENKKVLIIEKNAHINMNGADILKPSGINILEHHGLLDILKEKKCRVRDQLRVFHNGKHIQDIDYKKENERGYFMVCPYQILLETLYDQIKKMDTVELIVNQSISKIEQHEDTVEISITSKDSIFCDVLIGADGTRSFVREQVGINVDLLHYDHAMFFNKYPITNSVEELNRLYVDENGGLAYFYPINDKEVRCVLGFNSIDASQIKESKDPKFLKERLKKFVTESDDMLEKIDNLDNFITFPLCKMLTEKYFEGRVLLLGNAAHSIHPITGQGMNLAIEDTDELYHWLIKYFDKEIDIDQALSSYQEKRFTINEKVVAYGHRLATSFHSAEAFASSLNAKVQTSSRDISILNNI